MIGTIVNTLALLVGTSIGCFLKKGINKRFEDVLFVAMGLAALGIGWENVTNNMPKSHYPVLFIVSLALGGLCGTAWDISGHFDRLVEKTGKSNFLESVPRPCTWSECSCVTKIPSIVDGSISILFKAVSIFLLLTPASTNSLVFGVSTNKLFPLLPLYKLQKLNI